MLLLDKIVNLVPMADKGSILIKSDEGEWSIGALKGYSKEAIKVRLKNGDIVLYDKKENNKRIIKKCQLTNTTNRSDFRFLLISTLIRGKNSSMLSIPIYINAKLQGVLSIESKEDANFFSNRDVTIMNYLREELEQILSHFIIQDRFRYMATYDELTGLYNRRKLKQILSSQLSNNNMGNMTSCIALVDLDDFKNINDRYGHKAGDAALKYFADVMRKIITEKNICGRLYGDEFIIIFKGSTEEEAKSVLDTLRSALRQDDFKYGSIDFSYGIYGIPKSVDLSADEIICRADKNMYHDKMKKHRRPRHCNSIDIGLKTINMN